MSTLPFTADAVNLFAGTTPSAQTGLVSIKMKTNRFYTDGTLKSTGNTYSLAKAWAQMAVEKGWASEVVSGTALIPEQMSPATLTAAQAAATQSLVSK